MYRILIPLLLLLAPLVSTAQPVAYPPCYAAPGGAGTVPTKGVLANGQRWTFWHCDDGIFWRSVVMAEPADFRITMPDVAPGATISQILDAAWRANVAHSCDNPPTSIAAACAEALARAAAARPPDPVWRVAANQGRADRPVYLRNPDGTLGALAPERRAVVGEPCYCRSSTLLVGNTRYCRWDGAQFGDELTICTRMD